MKQKWGCLALSVALSLLLVPPLSPAASAEESLPAPLGLESVDKLTWDQAVEYLRVLENSFDSEEFRHTLFYAALVDFDGDSIPELLLSGGELMFPQFAIYAIHDSEAKQVYFYSDGDLSTTGGTSGDIPLDINVCFVDDRAYLMQSHNGATRYPVVSTSGEWIKWGYGDPEIVIHTVISLNPNAPTECITDYFQYNSKEEAQHRKKYNYDNGIAIFDGSSSKLVKNDIRLLYQALEKKAQETGLTPEQASAYRKVMNNILATHCGFKGTPYSKPGDLFRDYYYYSCISLDPYYREEIPGQPSDLIEHAALVDSNHDGRPELSLTYGSGAKGQKEIWELNGTQAVLKSSESVFLSGSPLKDSAIELLFHQLNQYRVQPNDLTISVNGQTQRVEAYLSDQNNFVRLRDIAQIIDFYVGWDPLTGSVYIDTTRGYEF